MVQSLTEQLDSIRMGITMCFSEVVLSTGILLMLLGGLLFRKKPSTFPLLAFLIILSSLLFFIVQAQQFDVPVKLFNGMLRSDDFSTYLKILFDIAGVLTLAMSWRNQKNHPSEFYALVLAVLLGAHLLVMSMNMLMVFISLELISISSYVLAGFAFTRKGAEGSLKYFLFGSVASAVMVYGFSILYGMTGTLDFSSSVFVEQLLARNSPLVLMAGLLATVGFLFKISAVPMHPWAPDVYEAAPMPVIAFFSVVPKLAGIGVLTKFLLALSLFGQSVYDWQMIIGVVAILTLTVGNFSALLQKNPKRLMAYSSIAQSGFLLVGVVAFMPQGVQFMLFYATVYLIMNFLVFISLQYFESKGIKSIEEFSGTGVQFIWSSVFLLIGMVALTGLPPTGGFTGKLFVFSSLWEAYQLSEKPVLLWLLVFGLLNTVVSLFYYLRIPYYAFIKSGDSQERQNFLTPENLLSLVLVILILALFFLPGMLMGWINKITFVL
ncbi:MAG: NADH-quinone oxidoreductase subunit N [Cyclobacteriaceae bacterium]|nr:NADH-quinone oxidoreductase subunit N [Cyclobacteriaceae bacterium]